VSRSTERTRAAENLKQVVVAFRPPSERVPNSDAKRARESVAARRGNGVPTPLSRFVGRARELGELRRLLPSNRLITIAGPGGAGKTRLALELADGEPARSVYWVDLAPLTEPDLLLSAIAASLALVERSGDLVTAIRDRLSPEASILVLDNCEHLRDACAEIAEALITTAPHLHILVTSREPLGVPGERVWRIPPLSLPRSTSDVERADALQLFVERARLVRSDFALSPATTAAVSDICRKLEGLPLAIELAAVWMDSLTPQELRGDLDKIIALPSSDHRIDRRHRSLQATFDWSWQLLIDAERTLFCRLGVFAGSFSRDAAEQVCGGSGDVEFIPLLARLVAKSMVVADPGDVTMRYRLLAPLRDYANERPEASGERPELQRRHYRFYLDLARRADADLHGPRQRLWVELLEREHDDLRAALVWAQEGEADGGASLAAALTWFWGLRGHEVEGYGWLRASLERANVAAATRARVFFGAAALAHHLCRFDEEVALGRESARISREIGDRHQLAAALWLVGTGELEGHGDAIEGRAALHESRDLARDLRIPWLLASAILNLAFDAHARGEASAPAMAEEALMLSREQQDAWLLSFSLELMAEVDLARGDFAQAERSWSEGIRVCAETGDWWALAGQCEGLARLGAARGDWERVRTLLAAADRLRREIGTPADDATRNWAADALARAREALAPAAAARADARGTALDATRLVAYALGEMVTPLEHPGHAIQLSRRERQVALLVTSGLTNREIGQRLFLSTRTVDAHLEHIRSKLGVRSRAEIAAKLAPTMQRST
jgi:predicted ATPase/DNA-binding CsgD family transcriptional regulator